MKTSNYRLDLGDERLWNGDQPVPISNKAFQLLRLFVDNPNRLLTKDDILDRVWRDVCVSDGLVKEYVHDLRLALGDDPKRPAYIETVHGRGYRFLGGVEEVNGPPGPDTSAQAAAQPPALAVLPIANLTDEERWARFCRGLGQTLTHSGRPEEALPLFDEAIRLSPYDPRVSSLHEMRGWALLVMGQHQEAAESARISVRRPNADLWAYATLCAALGHLGRLDEAEFARNELLKRKSDFCLGFVRRFVYYNKVSAHIEHYTEGLRKACVPE